jgi:predicted secreted protein
MKIKIAFVTIALFAIVSAFTTANFTDHHYKILADEPLSSRWKVENVDRTEGTGSGQFTCANSGNCVVNTVDVTPTQIGSFYYITYSNGSLTDGTITVH